MTESRVDLFGLAPRPMCARMSSSRSAVFSGPALAGRPTDVFGADVGRAAGTWVQYSQRMKAGRVLFTRPRQSSLWSSSPVCQTTRLSQLARAPVRQCNRT